jgi:hypothetical protein
MFSRLATATKAPSLEIHEDRAGRARARVRAENLVGRATRVAKLLADNVKRVVVEELEGVRGFLRRSSARR